MGDGKEAPDAGSVKQDGQRPVDRLGSKGSKTDASRRLNLDLLRSGDPIKGPTPYQLKEDLPESKDSSRAMADFLREPGEQSGGLSRQERGERGRIQKGEGVIGFAFGENKTDAAQIDAAVKLIEESGILQDPNGHVILTGHASSPGGAEFNQRLSQQRADHVKSEMIARDIPGDRISAFGFGEQGSEPAGDRAGDRVVGVVVSMGSRIEGSSRSDVKQDRLAKSKDEARKAAKALAGKVDKLKPLQKHIPRDGVKEHLTPGDLLKQILKEDPNPMRDLPRQILKENPNPISFGWQYAKKIVEELMLANERAEVVGFHRGLEALANDLAHVALTGHHWDNKEVDLNQSLERLLDYQHSRPDPRNIDRNNMHLIGMRNHYIESFDHGYREGARMATDLLHGLNDKKDKQAILGVFAATLEKQLKQRLGD